MLDEFWFKSIFGEFSNEVILEKYMRKKHASWFIT